MFNGNTVPSAGGNTCEGVTTRIYELRSENSMLMKFVLHK